MDIINSERIPPQNIEAEQSVLGSMLVDKDAVTTVAEILKSEDFYRENHKLIYEAVMDFFDTNEPVDIITVSEKLRTMGCLDETGGIEYLSNITMSVPTTANVKHYATIVWEKAMLRKLIKGANEIISLGYGSGEEVSHIMDSAEKTIFDILQDRSSKNFNHIKDILVDAFDRLEFLYNNKNKINGVASGFTDLDEFTNGFQKSDLILIASRPAMGKTALALNIAQHAAMMHKVPVALFNLEMSKEQLVNRMLASEVMIDSGKLRSGRLEDNDWAKLAQSMGPFSKSEIYIDDTPGISVMEIRAKCRRLKLQKNIGLIVIDYLQLIQGRGRVENRQQEVSEISRSLKILAKELDIPVITMAQVSRAPDARSDHRPMLSDLRESGAIEQDADIVMFIYRDDYYNPQSEKPNVAELLIAKNRNGSTGSVELRWFPNYTKFSNLAKDF